MATFRLSGENKKVSVVRRTRPVHVRNTLNVFPYGETEEFCNGLWLSRAMCITVYFTVSRPLNPQLNKAATRLWANPFGSQARHFPYCFANRGRHCR